MRSRPPATSVTARSGTTNTPHTGSRAICTPRCGTLALPRALELVERLVRLVRVVVADAEIGADVDVSRRQLQRLRVPLDRIVVALGVEVQVAELDARLWVRGLALGDVLERVHLRLVEHGRAPRRAAADQRGRRRFRRRPGRRAAP